MTSAEVTAEAEKLIAYWKRQLRLEDWDITIHTPEHDPECCGRTSYAPQYGRAHILIRNPAMHPPTTAADPDLELTIVHELLHVRHHATGGVFKKDSAEWDLNELATERTAQALVSLNRGIRR